MASSFVFDHAIHSAIHFILALGVVFLLIKLYQKDKAYQKNENDLLNSFLHLNRSSAEDQFSLENVPAIIYLCRGDEILYISKEIEHLSGYKVSELLGKSFSVLVPPEVFPFVRERAILRQQGMSVPSTYEVPLKRKDGSVFYVRLYSKKIDFKGEPAIVGVSIKLPDTSTLRSLDLGCI
jgi:PAS domain S-box-containing protein